MKEQVKHPYEPAALQLICFSSDDVMTGSGENDDFFYGDLDSFISLALK